jgi:hypothetical protein
LTVALPKEQISLVFWVAVAGDSLMRAFDKNGYEVLRSIETDKKSVRHELARVQILYTPFKFARNLTFPPAPPERRGKKTTGLGSFNDGTSASP